ncbi:response regulator [Bailinhaonella thermotolerans]|uniref:DNA-binding response regulator n=1 Tax=Bailinhaonella thermotolerans TaxID=1070861 RepID=A0A3A4A6M5_9ACTN|nr:response regulator transcription factor [Bailinhaonella thermotolerans]RJL23571.1 DNA-binding response regulator [Bailinhaonella thermotolerans]
MTIRVVLVDDQALIRDGIAALLQAGGEIEVVGQAENGREAVQLAESLRPDVVVMDIRMPIMDGLTATAEIMMGLEPPKVLVLTTFDEDEYVYEALAAGASGFMLKDASAGELIHAVKVVAAGDALLAPSITRRLISDFARRRPVRSMVGGRLDSLTAREQEVLSLIARGLSNTEIAEELVVAEQTVKTHIGRIFTKLGLRDRAQAVVVAYESGLVRTESA